MRKRGAIPTASTWTGAHFVGIDENGMGPRLGPLVVTSVQASIEPGSGAAALVVSRPRGAIARRIGDSKKLVAFDDSSLGEAWARAILVTRGRLAAGTTPRDLLRAVLVDGEDVLRAPCPSHHADMCWSDEGEDFAADDALVATCMRDLERLEAKGARIDGVRVAVVCTRRLNDAVGEGRSRFDVDLHTMERLVLAAREDAGAEVYALLGKVGGFDYYGDRFGPLAGWLHTALEEGRALSEYHVPGVGRLAFVRDGDEKHMLVGLASLVGKWVRDAFMRRIVRFHRGLLPDLPDASGYHNPVTTQFVAASAVVRKQRRVEDACFERRALSTSSAEPRSPKEPKRERQARAARAAPSSS